MTFSRKSILTNEVIDLLIYIYSEHSPEYDTFGIHFKSFVRYDHFEEQESKRAWVSKS